MLIAVQSPNAFEHNLLPHRRDGTIEYETLERSAGTQIGLCELILRSYFSPMDSALINLENFPCIGGKKRDEHGR